MARPETISRSDLLARLTGVFRSVGYEGASLALLARETGLAKAALYHRFPGGKEEMAHAVLNDVGRDMAVTVLRRLDGAGSPRQKLSAMRDGVVEFYDGGKLSCLADLFSVEGVPDAIRSPLAGGIHAWMAAIARVVEQAGVGPDEAVRRAEDAVVRVEGALVVSRALGSAMPFHRTMERLVDDLLA
ncbi:MAG: TetR/AcrR family transcriptional regulator [Rhizobiaceae bacterium]|nr:TetR/AcrR family transcriptional regulator [Rhizobiaceae bacterium]